MPRTVLNAEGWECYFLDDKCPGCGRPFREVCVMMDDDDRTPICDKCFIEKFIHRLGRAIMKTVEKVHDKTTATSTSQTC